jgi:hypothetical protein
MNSNLNGRTSIVVTIDDHPVTLPKWLSDTLPAIQTYLECMAMKKERVLWTLEVDGNRIDLAQGHEAVDCFQRIEAQTIGFRELGGHLISAGRTKISELVTQIEEAALLVLINDAPVLQRFWREWEPQLREPLFSIRALQELNGKKLPKMIQGQSISKCLEELSMIVCEVETLLFVADESGKEIDPIPFSELLEYTLLPWLRNVDGYLSTIAGRFDQLHARRRKSRLR